MNRLAISSEPSAAWKEPFHVWPFLRPALPSISLDDGVRNTVLNTDKESSMTRHLESYRYEIQYSDDADFVTYQRKSNDGGWQTVSTWMIPDSADY